MRLWPSGDGCWLLGAKNFSCKFEPALCFVPTVMVEWESYSSLPLWSLPLTCFFILLVSPTGGLFLPVIPARPTLWEAYALVWVKRKCFAANPPLNPSLKLKLGVCYISLIAFHWSSSRRSFSFASNLFPFFISTVFLVLPKYEGSFPLVCPFGEGCWDVNFELLVKKPPDRVAYWPWTDDCWWDPSAVIV